MDATIIEGNLAKAERHVSEGLRHVHEQRERVASLRQEGHDTDLSRALLSQFEILLALHMQDRERLLAALQKIW